MITWLLSLLFYPAPKLEFTVLPKDSFAKSGESVIDFDEWVSPESVTPLGKLRMAPDDFYYKDKVAAHRDEESLFKTLLFYKRRSAQSESLASIRRTNSRD